MITDSVTPYMHGCDNFRRPYTKLHQDSTRNDKETLLSFLLQATILNMLSHYVFFPAVIRERLQKKRNMAFFFCFQTVSRHMTTQYGEHSKRR